MALRGASAVLMVAGQYALQLRDEHAKRWPNQWGLFGGHIEPGETPRGAVMREVREELEVLLKKPKHLFDMDGVRIFFEDVTKQWQRHVLHEGKAAGLFSFEEAMGLGLNAVTMAALRAAEEDR